MNILVVDDHPIVREGLKQILSESPGMTVAGEAASGREALELFRKQKWDIVILDLSLRDRNGFDILKQMLTEDPRARILILTMHDEDQYAARVLKAGAYGFLNKEKAAVQLVSAVKTVASGKRFITPEAASALAEEFARNAGQAPHEALSDREFQVLILLSQGKSAKEIADQLCISAKTVNTYRSRVLSKMGLRSSAELIHYAMRNQLISF